MRKKILQLVVLPFLAAMFFCPIFVGNASSPLISQKFIADPAGLEYNGRIYVYCSHDQDGQSGYDITDFTCISTNDLVNWTDHGEVFEATEGTTWANRAYAPQVVYRDKKFYMYFANGGNGIGVAVSNSPTGPFKDALGKPLLTRNMNNCNVKWLFDPSVFIDDDGQAYLYFGGGGPGNARVIKLGKDMISTSEDAVSIDVPRYFEAPWMHKYQGRYYYSYSTDFSQGAAKIDYMMSSDPMKGFQYKGTVLDNPPDNLYNNNHAGIFQFKGDWYIVYHNRKVSSDQGLDNAAYQRSVCIDRLYYKEDGTIKKVVSTRSSLKQLKNQDPYQTMEAETMASQSGIGTENCGEGGMDITSISVGDWIQYSGVDFGKGASKFEVRVASQSEGTIEIRLGAADGDLVGTCKVTSTGGERKWETKSCNIKGAKGVNNLFLTFTGEKDKELMNINWFKFSK